MTLTSQHCEACHIGAPTVTDEEERELKPQIPDWNLVEIKGERRLRRSFRFDGWMPAVAFTNAVAELADMEDHHPSITTTWGKVTVSWWTHAIGGLHRHDFIMAAKTDDAYGKAEGRKES